jgi:hypothetical protein
MLEVLDRTDRQVKIRGFRVELGEIEAILESHPAVRRSAVVPGLDSSSNADLTAHIETGSQDLDGEALRRHVLDHAPQYAMPSAWVFHDALPLLSNGKVNYPALSPTGRFSPASAWEAPRDALEATLADIWTEVLGVTRVGIHDDFFALGGHSLLATQVLSRVRATLNVEASLRQLFETRTIARFAQSVAPSAETLPAQLPIPRAPREGPLPLSVGQQQVWLTEQFLPGTPLFNMPFAVRVSGPLDVDVLLASAGEIVRRHEVLRARFSRGDRGVVQTIASSCPLDAEVLDLASCSRDEQEDEAEGQARRAAYRLFDLATGPLLRIAVLRLSSSEHIVLLTAHHVAADGWSIEVLGRELGSLYGAFNARSPSPLADLPVQYAEFVTWQRTQVRRGHFDGGLAYWSRRLGDAPAPALPTDHPRPVTPPFDSAFVPVTIDADLVAPLRALSRQLGCTTFMVLLAAFKLTIARWTGHSEVRVATLAANRVRREWEALIGLFANTIVLRTNVSGNPTFGALVERVRTSVIDGYAHQDVPFEILVQHLDGQPGFDRQRLVNLEFQWEDADSLNVTLPALAVRPWGRRNRMADLGVSLTMSDMVMSVAAQQGEIRGMLAYKIALFDAETVERLGIDFSEVLRSAVQRPEQRLSEFPPARRD